MASQSRTHRQPRPPPRPRYGRAQEAFITKTRRNVEALGSSFFAKRDWTYISTPGGRNTCLNNPDMSMYAETFYVKPLAVWVPHLLLPDYIPFCPHCEKNDGIPLNIPTLDWVKHPKILYGLRNHRYLDTVYYRCLNCNNRKFAGYHEKSLELGGDRVVGIFNFHLSYGFAVDDNLYSHIINHASDTTASIYRRICLCHADEYMDSALYYFKAVEAKKIKPKKKGVLEGAPDQRTIDSMLSLSQGESVAKKRRRTLASDRARYERELVSARARANGDVQFADILRRKKNRNNIGQPFPGLGKQKLLTLLSIGITSAMELLEYDGNDKRVLPHWVDIVEAYYEKIRQEVETLEQKVDDIITDLDCIDIVLEMEEADEAEANNNVAANVDEAPPTAPPFSNMRDPIRYNSRVVSKSTIDRLVSTDHQNRKAVQDAKMRSIKANVLKIDWSYKLPPKVKVYTGRGCSFAPFKSHCSIQQEDALTVFWKMYPFHESFGPRGMQADLEALKRRFDCLGCTIKVIYVDNCCSVRAQLQAIFGAFVLVKLDQYHWMKRWDKLLYDPRSPEAAVFRGLLRRAVFMVEDHEYSRAEEELKKKLRRDPTASEVMKEAKSVIPPAETLKKRIDAVVRHVMHEDLLMELSETELSLQEDSVTNDRQSSRADANARKQRRFLKSTSDPVVRKLLKNQMKHVTCGCLSDPCEDVVRIHRLNPYSKKTFTARSTGTNEIDNRGLSVLLNHPSIGVARCERVMGDHYEASNDRKSVRRLGEAEQITTRSEKLYFLNSIAKAAGFDGDDLPIQGVSYPPSVPVEEHLGLTFDLPSAFKNSQEQPGDEQEDTLASTNNGVSRAEADADYEYGMFLSGIDFGEEDEDIPVDVSQFPRTNDNVDSIGDLINNLDIDDAAFDPIPYEEQQKIDEQVKILLPAINKRETTMDAFVRMTKHQPWIPFKKPNEPKEAVDEEEYQLFEKLRHEFNRFSDTPYGNRGYGRFAERWDVEVAVRFKASIAAIDNGTEPPVTIRRKTYEHLQMHYDRLLEHYRIANLARSPADDPSLRELNGILRNTRREVTPFQNVQVCQPRNSEYNPNLGVAPFGAPTRINTSIAAASVIYATPRNPSAPYDVRRSTAITPLQRNRRGQNFRDRKYCVVCGWDKSRHMRGNYTFGNLCSGNCGHEECSKCLQRVQFHGSSTAIGPSCDFAAHTNSKYNDWYKETPPQTTGII